MPSIEITLPTLHSGQVEAFWKQRQHKRFALRAGRRFGKTDFGKTLGCDTCIRGAPVGWFAPSYKILSEAYNEIVDILEPLKRGSSKTEGVIRVRGGGRMDFWTLDDERAGRSRKYKLVVVDEGAFTDNKTMMDTWQQAIEPTLLDLDGSAVVLSNTNGNDPENFFWRICNQKEHGFIEHHAPSWSNPHIPARKVGESLVDYAARRKETFAEIERTRPPLVFAQEYKAEFVDWSGAAFFEKEKLLEAGQPVDWPKLCDAVYAVIDSASKTGNDNDGTAVTYFAVVTLGAIQYVIILDWDIVQIEGALLETWVPTVFQNLEHMAKVCRARNGSLGAYIEDKDSGTILLQQCARHEWPAQACPSAMTAAGKDGRAISISGYVYRALVKFSRVAYEKTVTFKDVTRNHLWSQIMGFRVADPLARNRADDLLDCFCYGISLSLANNEGW